jgi:hypothetical protein
LLEFAKPGWNIHESSVLSLYDHRHFLLKFVREDSDIVQVRWSFPRGMDDALQGLMYDSEEPEELTGK